MSVDIQGGACLRMTQAGRHGTDVLIIRNQQCGGGMPEAVQGNHRELFIMAFVVSDDRIMECLIGRAVIHNTNNPAGVSGVFVRQLNSTI